MLGYLFTLAGYSPTAQKTGLNIHGLSPFVPRVAIELAGITPERKSILHR
jgi:hypothetical protein